MMSELRWTLLILGVVFIAALAWWERRRPRQARGAMERRASRESAPDTPQRAVRDPPLTLPEMHPRAPLATQELPMVEVAPEVPVVPMHESARGPGVTEEDTVDGPDAAHAPVPDPAAERSAAALSATPPPAEADSAQAPAAGRPREILPELPAAAPLVVEWPDEEERRILALRLVAPQAERFPGRSLRQALAAEGFLLGQFAIFHKPDDERRAVLSAASLTRPGTFDMETMDSQHYGGLSLFAVLPGPKSPPQAFDELVFAARNLNERLHGVLQDEHGAPLTPARIAQLREQLRAGTAS
jgi:cell division protein ZipA